jgi:CheY-like chemotaxis protein
MAHILVIEDDNQFRAMLKQMLQDEGHRVSEASDGEEGLQVASVSRPDLIITDILMPRKDGIDTIVALARRGDKTPVIAISGGRRSITADFNLESATMMGVEATLSKPFSLVDLRTAIRKALRLD